MSTSSTPYCVLKVNIREGGLYDGLFFFSVVLVGKQISLITQQVALLGGAGSFTTLARRHYAVNS